MKYKKILICILFALIPVLCGCSQKTQTNAPETYGTFEFSVLKVGKADAIVMRTQNHCVVMDCGEKDDGKKILDFLAQSGTERIDRLFITHFDKDHVGGAAKVINGIDIGEILVPDYIGSNDEYKDFLSAASTKGVKIHTVTENESFILDDVRFNVYPPQKSEYKTSDNDFSLVTDVTHGKNKMLFTGDAEEERISEILSTVSGEYVFLKVPHHGRYSSATESLVKATSPEYSVITDSDKNPADEKTLNILNKYDSKIYLTKDGTVSVSSDGKTLNITQDEN